MYEVTSFISRSIALKEKVDIASREKLADRLGESLHTWISKAVMDSCGTVYKGSPLGIKHFLTKNMTDLKVECEVARHHAMTFPFNNIHDRKFAWRRVGDLNKKYSKAVGNRLRHIRNCKLDMKSFFSF